MARSRRRKGEDEGRLSPTIDSLRVLVDLGDRLKAAEGHGRTYASLSEVAEAMDESYSKSNVFRALAELERKVYRRQLVNRSAVTLSAEGEAVYEWARSLLDLHARGNRWPIGERETVRIGTSNWILTFLMPEVVRAFHDERAEREDERTDVDLVFREFDVEELLVALRKGSVHAGLAAVWALEAFPGLTVKAIRERVATVMIASSGHKRWGSGRRKRTDEVSLGDLEKETVTVLEADVYRILAELPRPGRGGSRILVQSYAAVAALVRAGATVGFIPEFQRGDELDHFAYQGLEVFRVKERLPTRTLAILRRSGEELPQEVEEFLSVALDTLR